jgi:hypothetical protein
MPVALPAPVIMARAGNGVLVSVIGRRREPFAGLIVAERREGDHTLESAPDLPSVPR